MGIMLRVEQLEYSYGKSKRLSRQKSSPFSISKVNFELEPGYILGVLGRNGSGKSTLYELLYGNYKPKRGTIYWKGNPLQEKLLTARQEIAYAGHNPIFLVEAPVMDSVVLCSKLYPTFDMKCWREGLDCFEITEKMLHTKYIELSTGQRKRMELVFTLARKPELFLLDEPTANLDPVFRQRFMECIQRQVAERNASVVISTHIMADIENIVDYIMVLKKGTMMRFCDREQLFEEGIEDFVEVIEQYEEFEK